MAKKAQKIDPTPENQMELEADNMPLSSPIGKAARAYTQLCDKIDEEMEALRKQKDESKKKLLDLMADEEKEAVIVDGITYRKVHVEESDELRVYKKKKRSETDETGAAEDSGTS